MSQELEATASALRIAMNRYLLNKTQTFTNLISKFARNARNFILVLLKFDKIRENACRVQQYKNK